MRVPPSVLALLHGSGAPHEPALCPAALGRASRRGARTDASDVHCVFRQYMTLNRHLALPALRRAAEMGDAEAMVRYGLCLQDGCGGAVDEAAAADWYRRAMERGSAAGKAMFGDALGRGLAGLARDRRAATAFAREAAECGCGLGLWSWGAAAATDDVEALLFLRRGAAAGEPCAMDWLAWYLRNGVGCAPDEAGALAWARKAAERGEIHAMVNCARWSSGELEERAWWKAAALAGHERARRCCERVGISLAQRRSRRSVRIVEVCA